MRRVHNEPERTTMEHQERWLLIMITEPSHRKATYFQIGRAAVEGSATEQIYFLETPTYIN